MEDRTALEKAALALTCKGLTPAARAELEALHRETALDALEAAQARERALTSGGPGTIPSRQK